MADLIDLKPHLAKKLAEEGPTKLAQQILQLFFESEEGKPIELFASLVLAARALHDVVLTERGKEEADRALMEAYDLADQYQLIQPEDKS